MSRGWIVGLALGLTLASDGRPRGEHPPIAAPGAGDFMTSLDAAVRVARDEGRPLFIFFTASWCKPCHRMKAEALANAEVRTRLSRFIRVLVDTEGPEGKQAWQSYRVASLPTTIIASHEDPKTVAQRIEGVRTPARLVEDLDHAIETLAVPAAPGRERLPKPGTDGIPRPPPSSSWPWWGWAGLAVLALTLLAARRRAR